MGPCPWCRKSRFERFAERDFQRLKVVHVSEQRLRYLKSPPYHHMAPEKWYQLLRGSPGGHHPHADVET